MFLGLLTHLSVQSNNDALRQIIDACIEYAKTKTNLLEIRLELCNIQVCLVMVSTHINYDKYCSIYRYVTDWSSKYGSIYGFHTCASLHCIPASRAGNKRFQEIAVEH